MEERIYLSLLLIVSHGSMSTTGRDFDAGTKAETMEECCLLVCFPWLAQPTFYITQDNLNMISITSSRLDSHISIINQEIVPQTCLQANLIEAFS